MTYLWRLVDTFRETIREGVSPTFASARESLGQAVQDAARAENYNYRYDCIEEQVAQMREGNSYLNNPTIKATIEKEQA